MEIEECANKNINLITITNSCENNNALNKIFPSSQCVNCEIEIKNVITIPD